MSKAKQEDVKKGKTRKVFCRNCKQQTNHLILNEVEKFEDWGEEQGIWVSNKYFTLQCKGCEIVCLVYESVSSEDWNPATNEIEPSIVIHPSPYEMKTPFEFYYYLPKAVAKIYIECITAFNRKLPILTSIGMRTTIEAICQDKKITGGNLKKKIDALASLGLMTLQEAELLHLNRFMGNASAHELLDPSEDDLTIGLEIIETTLRNAYILPEKAQELRKKYTA